MRPRAQAWLLAFGLACWLAAPAGAADDTPSDPVPAAEGAPPDEGAGIIAPDGTVIPMPGRDAGIPGSDQAPVTDDLDLRNLRNVFGVPPDEGGTTAPPTDTTARLPAPDVPFKVAVLRGLDKITARVSTFDAPVDQAVRFGTLDIVVRACRERPPTETPESAAFLDVREIKPDETTAHAVFHGWMFASSPSLSALEHPVYDLTVIACKDPVVVPNTAAAPARDEAAVPAADDTVEDPAAVAPSEAPNSGAAVP